MNPMFYLRVRQPPGAMVIDQPVWTFLLRAVVLAVLVPLLLGLLLVLLTLAIGGAPGDLEQFVLIGSFSVLVLATWVYGAILALGAPWWSRRSRVTVDWQAGAMSTGDGRRIPLSELARLSFQRSEYSCRLEACLRDGSRARLLGGGSALATGLEAASRRLAEEARVPLEAPARSGSVDGERWFAAACHFPVQGVFLMASLIALFASKSAFVRFNAIQSLLHLVCVLLLLGAGSTVAVPLLLLVDVEPLRLVIGVAYGGFLVCTLLANMVVRLLAMYRAYRGRVWLFPWLRPLLSKHIPGAPASSADARAATFR